MTRGSRSRGPSNVHKSGLLLLGVCVSTPTVCPCQLRSPDEWRNVCGSQSQTRPWGSVKTPVSERDVWGQRWHVVCLYMSSTGQPTKLEVVSHPNTKLDLKGSYAFCFPFSFTNLPGALAEQLAYGRVTSPTLTRCGGATCLPSLSQPLWRASSRTLGPPPPDKQLQRVRWELLTQNNMELQTKPWANLEQGRTPCRKIHFCFFLNFKTTVPKKQRSGRQNINTCAAPFTIFDTPPIQDENDLYAGVLEQSGKLYKITLKTMSHRQNPFSTVGNRDAALTTAGLSSLYRKPPAQTNIPQDICKHNHRPLGL